METKKSQDYFGLTFCHVLVKPDYPAERKDCQESALHPGILFDVAINVGSSLILETVFRIFFFLSPRN